LTVALDTPAGSPRTRLLQNTISGDPGDPEPASNAALLRARPRPGGGWPSPWIRRPGCRVRGSCRTAPVAV